MMARVTSVQVRPADVAESVRLFDESVIPAAEQEEGRIVEHPSREFFDVPVAKGVRPAREVLHPVEWLARPDTR
jgi:hypothetical protein